MDSERSYLALPSEDSQKLSPAFLKSKLHSLIGVSARWKKEKEEGKGEPSPSRVEGEGRAGGEQEWKDRLRKWSVAKARAEVLLLFKNLHIRAGGQSQLLGLSPDKAETVKVETRVDRDMEKADSEVVETEPETRFVYNSAVIALAVYLCVGVAMYSLVGGFLVGSTTNNFIDALYFCIVTITSVGYGDLSPQTVPAKVFTCFFVFAGFGLLNILLSEAAEYLVRKQESTVMDYLEIGRKAQHRSDHALLQMEESIFKRIETSRRKSWKRVLVAGGAVLLALLVGAGVLHYGEGLAPLDALYCACVTVTTVGYGDESFTTLGGRAFAVRNGRKQHLQVKSSRVESSQGKARQDNVDPFEHSASRTLRPVHHGAARGRTAARVGGGRALEGAHEGRAHSGGFGPGRESQSCGVCVV